MKKRYWYPPLLLFIMVIGTYVFLHQLWWRCLLYACGDVAAAHPNYWMLKDFFVSIQFLMPGFFCGLLLVAFSTSWKMGVVNFISAGSSSYLILLNDRCYSMFFKSFLLL